MAAQSFPSLKRDLETRAMLRGVSVPEVVATIKASMNSQGPDPEICRDFYEALDEAAELMEEKGT